MCALRFSATGSSQSSVGREEHIGVVQSAVSNTIYEVTEAIIISVAARATRRKLVDFPPTPWLPRMRRRRRLRYSATSQACYRAPTARWLLFGSRKLGKGDTVSILSRKGYYTLNVMVKTQDTPSSHGCLRQSLAILTPAPPKASGEAQVHAQFCGATYWSAEEQVSLLAARSNHSLQPRAVQIIYACTALHNIDPGDWTLEELCGGVPPAEQSGDEQALEP
ncbi:hypothetical protein HPB50_017058 [Hyalomma asiaticum]|uniref:Uncharacterized protein n=1 Tax=Hyalomma asiaticum TaxID=266040 RepID=A0ACB7S3V1_HYAAI|nr:hypothetical protein HPB50_017058 [Hyalomma asiaticum]